MGKSRRITGSQKICRRRADWKSRYSPNPLRNNDDLNYINDTLSKAPRGNNEFSEDTTEDTPITGEVPVKAEQDDGGRKTEVSVNVTLNPTFQINGSGGTRQILSESSGRT